MTNKFFQVIGPFTEHCPMQGCSARMTPALPASTSTTTPSHLGRLQQRRTWAKSIYGLRHVWLGLVGLGLIFTISHEPYVLKTE